MSDTAVGMKGMLRDLESYCERSKLTVNTGKTMVMILKKGGARRKVKDVEL